MKTELTRNEYNQEALDKYFNFRVTLDLKSNNKSIINSHVPFKLSDDIRKIIGKGECKLCINESHFNSSIMVQTKQSLISVQKIDILYEKIKKLSVDNYNIENLEISYCKE